jgi:hypothetical protein
MAAVALAWDAHDLVWAKIAYVNLATCATAADTVLTPGAGSGLESAKAQVDCIDRSVYKMRKYRAEPSRMSHEFRVSAVREDDLREVATFLIPEAGYPAGTEDKL